MGIGKVPDGVLHHLTQHNDLGIHTEMFSDGLLQLYRKGNVSNNNKGINIGKSVTSFCFGTQELYDFVNDNPHVEFHPSEYVNNPVVIAQNRMMISINSAIEIDLTGQVVADSIGYRFYSGIGGQVDFIRGAGMSQGGRPIIALPSTANGGKVSRIVPLLSEGAGVVTSRGDVHYVVAEYGIATLRGRSIRERALELIQVAHPDFREQLLKEVRQHFRVPPYQKSKLSLIPELGSVEITRIVVNDRTFFLRPLRPSDQRRLQEFFYTHSQSTLLQRYRYIPKNMSTERAYELVNIDQTKDLALCFVERQGPREVIFAVGRYFLQMTGKSAEVAYVVKEEVRGLGLGATLMQKIIRVARQRGLTRLIALIRVDNLAMRTFAERFGFAKEPTSDPAELTYILNLKMINESTTTN